MTPRLAPNGGELVKRLRELAAPPYDSAIFGGAMARAADRIEALETKLVQVEAVNLDMTARMDRISTGVLYADLTTRATSAELTITALRERLEGIAAICAGELSEEWASLVAHSAPSSRVKPDNFERAKQLVCDYIDQIHTLAKGPRQ